MHFAGKIPLLHLICEEHFVGFFAKKQNDFFINKK